jgi:hypothetical protein
MKANASAIVDAIPSLLVQSKVFDLPESILI